jgi:hypothetical protein
MYHAYALMQPSSDLTLPAVAEQIKAQFPHFTVEQGAAEIVLTSGDWDYHLLLETGPSILNESEGLAGRIAGLDDDAAMRSCDRRLNVWSDTPDPFMEHFDNNFQVLGVLRAFKGIILVDPSVPGLL